MAVAANDMLWSHTKSTPTERILMRLLLVLWL